MIINPLNNLKISNCLLMLVVISVVITLFTPAVFAQSVRHSSDFNHMRTGFPLTGAHTNIECETCHVGGIFKGTPTNCEGCHSAGRRVVAPGKPASHIITNAPCERCHTNAVTFMGARFDHMGVQPKGCIACHNGGMAPGKPGGHVSTNAVCDTCHRTSAWIPASFNHVGVLPGTCTNCHGVTAIGKPGGHVVTTLACDSCHLRTSWIPASYNHIGVTPNTCANCHGVSATGKPANHIPTTITDPLHCDACHLSTSVWSSEKMNHNNIPGKTGVLCTTCHLSGTSYLGSMDKKSLTHEASGHTDCSDSGCHRPLGNEGTSYQSWK